MARKKIGRWRVLRLRGLQRRWLFNTVMPVFLLLILLVVAFSVGICSYYYGSMQKGLESRAQAMANSFNDYFMDSGYNTYYQMAVRSAESFEDKDRIEMQFINSSGRIQVSTSGLTAGTSPGTPDIGQAQAGSEMTPYPYQGIDPETGEQIMAVSYPLASNGRVVGVLRLVTSLRVVNSQVLMMILLVVLVSGLCMSLIIMSNLIFINSVVEPVAVVTESAKRISDGSYGFQIEKQYPDELGELVKNINLMSLKISQNEKMQTEFISSVSHELRTPLTAINGWGETILEDPTGDPEQLRRGIRIILNESVHHGGGTAGVLQNAGRPLYTPD